MPLFNGASRIYNPSEIRFMRSCFGNAAILLEESDRGYSASDLASCIMMLYENGLRDREYLCELSARIAHQRYQSRHDVSSVPDAQSYGTMPASSSRRSDPFG